MKERLTPDLLRALGHELRGPLGALGNWVQVLRSHKAGPDARALALDGMVRDVKAMNDLIGHLVDLTSLEGGPTLEPAVLDLAPFIEDLLAAAAQESGLAVRLISPSSATRVMASPTRLREMLWLFVAVPPDAPDRALGLSISTEGALVELSIEARYPRPLTLALAGALAETQGGEMVETAGEEKTLLRFYLRLAT